MWPPLHSSASISQDLVIFNYVIEHVSRLARIIKQPFANALLIGVGGSGRQSCTRLAASIAENKLFSITLSKTYNKDAWRDDMRLMLRQAGAGGQPTVFLFMDSQIMEESFLEDISNILNTGEPKPMGLLEVPPGGGDVWGCMGCRCGWVWVCGGGGLRGLALQWGVAIKAWGRILTHPTYTPHTPTNTTHPHTPSPTPPHIPHPHTPTHTTPSHTQTPHNPTHPTTPQPHTPTPPHTPHPHNLTHPTAPQRHTPTTPHPHTHHTPTREQLAKAEANLARQG